MFVLCSWLIDSTVGELKSSEIHQSGEHDIEFSANPAYVIIQSHGVSAGAPRKGTCLRSIQPSVLSTYHNGHPVVARAAAGGDLWLSGWGLTDDQVGQHIDVHAVSYPNLHRVVRLLKST